MSERRGCSRKIWPLSRDWPKPSWRKKCLIQLILTTSSCSQHPKQFLPKFSVADPGTPFQGIGVPGQYKSFSRDVLLWRVLHRQARQWIAPLGCVSVLHGMEALSIHVRTKTIATTGERSNDRIPRETTHYGRREC